jgi:hypothetical protein
MRARWQVAFTLLVLGGVVLLSSVRSAAAADEPSERQPLAVSNSPSAFDVSLNAITTDRLMGHVAALVNVGSRSVFSRTGILRAVERRAVATP